jgi:hypothetical protein
MAAGNRTAQAPFGPPTPETVHLDRDGSVVCMGCDVAPAVSEVAILLQAMLTSAVKVPGGLRYALARALLEVDARPFDSLADFSRTLARFEQGDRRGVVRSLLERNAPKAEVQRWPDAVIPLPPRGVRPVADRRKVAVQVTELRRHLREADQRLFEQQVAARKSGRMLKMPRLSVAPAPSAAEASGPVAASEATAGAPALVAVDVPDVPDVLNRASKVRVPAIAASAAAALLLIAAAEFIHVRHGMASAPAAPGGGHLGPAAKAPAPPSPASTGLSRGSAAPPRHRLIASTAGNRGALTNTRSDGPVSDDHTAGEFVTTLDVQHRPVFSPAFASKESAIFFHTGRNGDARSALEVATPGDGAGDLRVITILDDGARNYHVQPSPDGRSIAFDSDRDGERGIYVANRDGSDVRRVSGNGYAAVPTWAPDGKRLAYVRAEPENPRVWNLWLLSLDPHPGDNAGPAGAVRLTHYGYGQAWAASWFSDGRRICYTHEDRIVILDLVNGRSREFESPVKGHAVRTPAVSPDGEKVIFQVYRRGAWLLDLRNGSMRPVLTDPTAEEFAWAPDGRRIAFHSRRDGQWGIYVYGGK